MIILVLINLIIILLLLFFLKKIIKNYYLSLVLIYLLILTINFLYLSEKFIENNVENIWLNFALITFFVTMYSWLHGLSTKSVSLKMLIYIKNKNSIKTLKPLTDNIVKQEFNDRIDIIKKLKFVNFKNNKFLLNKKGIKTINKIIALRKVFKIFKNSFYGRM